MDGVILIAGFVVAHYLAKLGKTDLQGAAIWLVTVGAFLFGVIWYFDLMG
jgi:hypothetical protein